MQTNDLIDVCAQGTYNTVLNLACTRGSWPDVNTILANMERHKISIGEAGVTSLIRLHMASGNSKVCVCVCVCVPVRTHMSQTSCISQYINISIATRRLQQNCCTNSRTNQGCC